MGHYMATLKETNDEYKFPTIEASVIPLTWLKRNIGIMRMVISYTKEDDKDTLKEIATTGTEYEREVAQSIIQAINDTYEQEVILEIELPTSAGGVFLKMFKEILPSEIIFDHAKPVGHWEVKHDHKTIPIAKE